MSSKKRGTRVDVAPIDDAILVPEDILAEPTPLSEEEPAGEIEPAPVEETEDKVPTVVEAEQDTEDNNTNIRTDKIGVVANCDRLNVRAEADLEADIISVLAVGSEVLVNDEKSTRLFYNISTSAGLEGFCMKAYISK